MNWINQINEVVAYIEQNLDGEIDNHQIEK
ncbi:hypothetical protein M2475_001091 [Breznakia sp. PF5-3]|nr:hypothetical protein [Breznakia sp. PM6-1]MDF9835525.1 hypothetical protein [Breznakia sp. PF5-3]MDF9838792.1 hypothetical protein [Breznakia sp. PFB2-8]MDF9860820.1 hypothetical protein [Breznakia sp. PH5-24]